MSKYILKRVILAIVSIVIVSAITFFAMNLIPGGPFNKEKAVSPQVIEELNKRYNLDKPVPQQYVLYMQNILKGDWGVSLNNGRPIWPDITSRFAVSAKLGWIPVFDADNPNYILPIIALSVYPMAYITRLTKTSMLDALNQDYIRTAKAKGVARSKLIFVHALRNALIPVVTYLGPEIAYILTGSMVVESIFTIGGLGSAFVTSINNRDYTMIMAVTIFLAILMVVANLLTDIAYKFIDPRIDFNN